MCHRIITSEEFDVVQILMAMWRMRSSMELSSAMKVMVVADVAV